MCWLFAKFVLIKTFYLGPYEQAKTFSQTLPFSRSSSVYKAQNSRVRVVNGMRTRGVQVSITVMISFLKGTFYRPEKDFNVHSELL